MPPPRQVVEGGSTFDKMKMGALMGTGVGLTIGLIFGLTSIIRAGPGPRGTVATLSQYMLSSAATFGFFMSIGSVIRTESKYSALQYAQTPASLAWARMAQRQKVEIEVKEKRE
ncbi:reactive mitochondrial oxygen species modulator 1-domain-containing protein [Kockovaella imperatae]|uniref:Reactive mitochondrial oxygen species modulator 1-domain-containing protein n=1 Tax=Kockovaella imperatae TaxID=4999 RepID=A0A1Y1UJB9_9TREE|nr:reactive mitochondrial oxygen species modulator 1-domain-containing protein [Kockovaella imperatae]ORX37637.1 reactive mitochondrial oxygen species modulator 1-domain-containing protein [Kockovaella imperatae]